MKLLFRYKPFIFKQDMKRHVTEKGVIVYWLAMLCVAIVGLAAFVIDETKQELHLSQIKNAADSAAHAMAIQLDGTLDETDGTKEGWLPAKRVAIQILKEHGVLGGPNDLAVSFDKQLDDAKADPWEKDIHYLYNAGEERNVTVFIERGGIYPGNGEAAEKDPAAFISFEGQNKWKFDHKSYQLANAAKVTIKVFGLKNYFARVFGLNIEPLLSVTSYAVHDRPDDSCIAPLALPACEMMFAIDQPGESLEQPNKKEQCFREAFFAESKAYYVKVENIQDPGSLTERTDAWLNFDRFTGIERYLAYEPFIIQPNQDGSVPFKYRVPLKGQLGVYSSGEPVDEEDDTVGAGKIEELKEYFRGNGGCAQYQVGQQFKPMVWGSREMCNKSTDKNCGDGILDTSHNEDISQSIVEKYFRPNGAQSKTYEDVFTGSNGNLCRADLFRTESNCPAFPTYPTASMTWNPVGKWNWTWMSGHSENTFTNPLCHDQYDRLPANDINQPVKKIRVALVAPSAEDENGNPLYTYCSWIRTECKRTNNDNETCGKLSLVLPKTKPIVVGTAEISLLDFNLFPLENGALNPPDVNPAGWLPYVPPRCENMPQNVLDVYLNTLEVVLQTNLPRLNAQQVCGFLRQNGHLLPLDNFYQPPFVNAQGQTFACEKNNPKNAANLPYAHCTTHPAFYPDGRQYPIGKVVSPLLPQYGCGGIRGRLQCVDEPIRGAKKGAKPTPMLVAPPAKSVN